MRDQRRRMHRHVTDEPASGLGNPGSHLGRVVDECIEVTGEVFRVAIDLMRETC